jgi:hypothetical protein
MQRLKARGVRISNTPVDKVYDVSNYLEMPPFK